MSDEELMRIAFADKRTVQDVLRYIFELGEQKGRADAIDEFIKTFWQSEVEFRPSQIDEIIKIAEQLKEQKE